MTTQNNLQIDFLNPKKLWIGRRCYRVLTPDVSTSTVNYAENDTYLDDQTYNDDVDCRGEKEDIPIQHLDNGKVQTNVQIPCTFFPYLIGVKGVTKKRIEMESGARLIIPSKGQSGDIIIIGRDVKGVRQARVKLDLLVDSARKKQPFTHFVSIPVNGQDIQANFLRFKDEVFEKCHSRGIDNTIFQSPEKLHLTLSVCALMDDRERTLVTNILTEAKDKIKESFFAEGPLLVQMRGIEYMNDDPGEVDVLYGKVESKSWTTSLQDLANHIKNLMVPTGFSQNHTNDVKLHVTLMNTLFRRQEDAEYQGGKRQERETFDAREILKEFSNYEFGEMEICEIHLSVRYTTSTIGYYNYSTKIDISN